MASKIAFLRLAMDLERGKTRRCVLAAVAPGRHAGIFSPGDAHLALPKMIDLCARAFQTGLCLKRKHTWTSLQLSLHRHHPFLLRFLLSSHS